MVDTLRGLDVDRLNESLPHKRKRLAALADTDQADNFAGLNESLPHKRKRPVSFLAGCNNLERPQ